MCDHDCLHCQNDDCIDDTIDNSDLEMQKYWDLNIRRYNANSAKLRFEVSEKRINYLAKYRKTENYREAQGKYRKTEHAKELDRQRQRMYYHRKKNEEKGLVNI